MTSSSSEEVKKIPPSPLKNFLSGGVGGMALVACGHPFDLIKVRLQTSNEYSGIVDCVKRTIAKDGVRGLYRGMSAPLMGVTPIFAVCFWGYDQGQRIVRWGSGMNPSDQLSLSQIAIAGGYSAIPTTLIMTPAERIKVMLQVQGGSVEVKYKGPVDVVRAVWKEGGVPAFYKGTVGTLLRDVPGSVAYFGVYEFLKRTLTGGNKDTLSPGAVLFAGGMAGVANWSVAIPGDVIKSRMQVAPPGTYKGFTDCVTQLLKKEGPQALFKGLGPAMLRAFPANAACFLGVEVSLKVMNSLW